MSELKNNADWQDILHTIDTFLFDCDGVIWHGLNPLPGAVEAVSHLKQMGKQVYFVTNKNTQSRSEILHKFCQLGFSDISIESVYTSSYVTSQYLRNVLKLTGKVYLIGNEGIKTELETAGICCLEIGPDPISGVSSQELESIQIDSEVQAVVVATDYSFGYKKLVKAFFYLQSPECHFIGTSEDQVIPVANGSIVPGATGSFIRAIQYSAGRSATVIGKPYLPIIECMEREFPLDRSKALMIGDNLTSDIQFARRAGVKSLLVLSGVTKRDYFVSEQGNLPVHLSPHFFTDSLTSLTTQ